jgi:hypothetical protein
MVVVIGCASDDPGEAGPETDVRVQVIDDDTVVLVDLHDWRDAVRSLDARVRAAGADAAMGDVRADASAVLEDLARNDPAARVRERALLAYAAVRGRDAKPLLEEIASQNGDQDVVGTAMATLHGLREAFPEPEKSWMRVEHPDDIRPGVPFTLTVRLGSSAEVPRAKVFLHLPSGVEQLAPEAGRWTGEVRPNADRTLTYTLRTTGKVGDEPMVLRALMSESRVRGEVHEVHFDLDADESTAQLRQVDSR